jgi:hypothetical protein
MYTFDTSSRFKMTVRTTGNAGRDRLTSTPSGIAVGADTRTW